MGFSLSFSLFFVIIVFYIVIVQVFTILFRITGLTEEKARFQVISLLTNSGYTTKESELVVDVLSRRKLARIIMLFGYVFSITVVSVFVNMMTQLPTSEKDEVLPALIIVSSLFVVFLILWRVPIVKTALDSVFEQLGRKWLYGNQQNVILVQDEYPRGVIAQVTLNEVPKELEGKTLAELSLMERYGIHVIFVNRGGVLQMDSSGRTELKQGDIATVFGPLSVIRKVFSNKQAVQKSELAMAPKPESEAEFIHQQDVANAEAAAAAARKAAEAEKEAAQKAKLAAEALEAKSAQDKKEPNVLEKIKDAFAAGGPAPAPGSAGKSAEAAMRAAPDAGKEKTPDAKTAPEAASAGISSAEKDPEQKSSPAAPEPAPAADSSEKDAAPKNVPRSGAENRDASAEAGSAAPDKPKEKQDRQ